MGYLDNGIWVDKWYDTSKSKGAFIRENSQFRHLISTEHPTFKPEKNRYHLYVSHACPWAHRTLIFRHLKQLEDIISVSVVHPLMKEHGWVFKDELVDHLFNFSYLHQVYSHAKKDYSGRVTVPVLFDKKTNQIVNNESSEIIRIFNTQFNELTKNTSDFYPTHLQHEIDEINDLVYHNINNGVYKCGFATSQTVYENALQNLFNCLDTLELKLQDQNYLINNQLTEADWRLFTTLIRFDAVYVGHFKCNIKQIRQYPNLFNYLKRLVNYPGIKQSIHMDHIKSHYYESHTMINPTGIIPVGPDINYDL